MAIVWDKAVYDELYSSCGWKHGMRGSKRTPRFHYHWYCQQDRLQKIISYYLSLPGFNQVNNVAIVGGGFGWTAELLLQNGINAFSVDTSPFIIDNENISEEAELRAVLQADGFDPDNLPIFVTPQNTVLAPGEIWNYWLRSDGIRTSIPVEQEDLSTNGSRNAVKKRLNGGLDAILSEYLLDSVSTDSEALVIVERMEQTRPNPACAVIHLVGDGTTTDPRFLTKDLAGWQALLVSGGFTDHYILTHTGQVVRADGAG